jgi:DNA-binding GntR family transcriptional regulator
MENSMDFNRVDTERAYHLIREKIITLDLAPGSPVDVDQLVDELQTAPSAVPEALRLLAHEGLIALPPDGIFVGEVSLPDLRQLSELRRLLEGFAARLAADRATEDDLTVLDALRQEQAKVPKEDVRRLFDVDHKFHRAIARAAHNEYLADVMDRFYGLSLRLWYLAKPDMAVLAKAVDDHLDLLTAIRNGEVERAEQLMQKHIGGFYDHVLQVLEERGS